MNTGTRSFRHLLAAVVVSALIVSAVNAQSSTKSPKSYGAASAQSQSDRYGASFYSARSIQQQILNQSVTRDRRSRPSLGSYRPPDAAKPFSSISRAPSVSPYLALDNSFNQVSDYYNIVRPQQQQRRINQQVQRQNQNTQRRLSQLTRRAAEGPYSPRGNAESAPTGHAAGFQSFGTYLNTGRYFPEPGGRRR